MVGSRSEAPGRPSEDTSESGNRPILDAAHALFLEFGLRRTTMDDIARRAGVGRVTVYRHYADKNALFAAVVMRECWRALRSLEEELQPYTDVDEYVVEWFTRMVFTAEAHPLRRRLLVSDPEWFISHLTIDGTPILELGIAYVTGVIERLQARGVATEVDSKLLGELVLRVLHSIHLTPGGMLAPATEDESREVARRFLLPLLRASTRS